MTPSAEKPSAPSDKSAAEIAAIRAQADAFVGAFNKGDAKAIAELWTENGEYIDDAGRRFVGREAIEKGYQEFFSVNPGAKIQIAVDAVRLLGDSTAIEDGRAATDPPGGNAGGFGRYTAIHIKVDGNWKLASVRDAFIAPPADVTSAADLEWLIGTWVAEEHGVKTTSVCRWVVEGRFIERRYTTTDFDGTTSSGLQLVGWNPLAGHVQSWSFSPDGGHAVGVWFPQPDGWAGQMRGMGGDGAAVASINVLRKLDDDAYVWQSVHRSAAGQTLPDTVEVVWKRQPASTD